PYQQFYPDEATVIQVDVRGSQIGKRTKVDIALTGTVADTVNALLPLIRTGRSSSFLKTATKHYAKTRKELDELATPSKRTIHPQYLTKLIDEAAT
ncbi:ubiquinone-dependent pyruvate dehydrogenase, partial [Burkholderia multivorans]